MTRFARMSPSRGVGLFLAVTLLTLCAITGGQATENKVPKPAYNAEKASFLRDFRPGGGLPPDAIEDMRGRSEAIPAGAASPAGKPFGWALAPRENLGNRLPSKWTMIIATGMIYPVDGATSFKTPRVQIKDLRLYVRMEGRQKWQLLQAPATPRGAFYRLDFSEDDHAAAKLRLEESGGLSVTLPPGRNFHFFAPGRVRVPAGKVTGVYARFDARLIDDRGRPFESAAPQYVASASADYWLDSAASWAGAGVNNDDVAIGKFKRLRGKWRTFSMHTALEQASPPNLKGLH